MWIVFSLAAAFAAAVYTTLSKAGLKDVESSVGFAIQTVLILCISWGVVWWQGNIGEVAKIERGAWGYLLAAGVVTSLSSLLLFRALKLGDAGRVSSLDRVSLVFAIIFAVVFLKEKVNWQVISGAVLMAGGALLIAMAKK